MSECHGTVIVYKNYHSTHLQTLDYSGTPVFWTSLGQSKVS